MSQGLLVVLHSTLRGTVWGAAVGLGVGYVSSPSGTTTHQRPGELDGPTYVIIGFVVLGAIGGLILGFVDGVRTYFMSKEQ